MTAIQVQLARDADRDDLLKALSEQGLEPEVLDGADLASLELRCDDADSADFCADLERAIGEWLTASDLPLIPQRIDDRIVLRPPAD